MPEIIIINANNPAINPKIPLSKYATKNKHNIIIGINNHFK